jgi:hypothetical protein
MYNMLYTVSIPYVSMYLNHLHGVLTLCLLELRKLLEFPKLQLIRDSRLKC